MSSQSKATVIVFFGDHARSDPERLMSGACEAALRDLVDLALQCALIDRVIVATNSPVVAANLANKERVLIERDAPGEPFHFGQRLLQIVETHGVERPLYFGAASAPLLSAETLEFICRQVTAQNRIVVTNNRASADFFAFAPAGALRRIPLPGDQDNHIPFLLARQAGLPAEVLSPAIETMFDLDTPTDLLVLAVQSRIKAHMRRYVESVQLNTTRIQAAMPFLLGRFSQVTLIGRVNTMLWGQNPSDIPGPKRIFAEERNMKSFGRDRRGEARTLIGDLYQLLGPKPFFDKLSEYSDVILFDTRVLFAHLGLQLSANDRFASDMGAVQAIQDPVVREFTAAANACDVPVILGGQNIVSGVLWALVQEAWDRADAGLLTPQLN